jgi:hypothetical protein
MKTEFKEEYNLTEQSVMKKLKEEEEEEERKEKSKEENKGESNKKGDLIVEKKEEKSIENTQKEYMYKRAWELSNEGLSYRKIAEELGIKSHLTAKKYCEKYIKKLEQEKEELNNPERIEKNIGEGVLKEEIETNFN